MRPLVSIIIPTKNNARTIQKCVGGALKQTYPNIEILVIDNFSTDETKNIVQSLGVEVISFGPERNLQRPEGSRRAKGEWLIFLDSDMYLSPTLVEDCLNQVQKNQNIEAFVLPEISIGKNFWTRCKILERKFYLHYKPMESARLMKKSLYERVGGWDQTLISGEDFDLHERLEASGIDIGRSHEFIEHDEGEIKLWPYLRKKVYYGQYLKGYLNKSKKQSPHTTQKKFFFLRSCFYTKPKIFFQHPILYGGMFILLFLTQSAYIIGVIKSKKAKKQ